ncbi:hypothetical protein DESC_910046 [Desulfosarcina cetonica]|nr:hypothetical protein DESC_910046 [Desulfosarcina cetonica]
MPREHRRVVEDAWRHVEKRVAAQGQAHGMMRLEMKIGRSGAVARQSFPVPALQGVVVRDQVEKGKAIRLTAQQGCQEAFALGHCTHDDHLVLFKSGLIF